MNTRELEGLSPLQKIVAVRALFIATIYLCSGIATKEIPLSMFNKPLLFAPNDEEIFISHPEWNDRDLHILEGNLLRGMMSICCIGMDEALDSRFGKKPQQYPNSDIGNLRAIIYMMRCAFAHTPTLPKWEISKSHQKVFSINEIDMTIDFRILNGKKLVLAHHHGVTGFCKLMDLCVRVIEAND